MEGLHDNKFDPMSRVEILLENPRMLKSYILNSTCTYVATRHIHFFLRVLRRSVTKPKTGQIFIRNYDKFDKV